MGNDAHRSPRIACLGVGWIGRHRMQALVEADAAHVVAIADPDPRALEAAGTLVPQAERFSDASPLFDLGLDGLVIATPSAMHATQSIAALRAGLAVFCQKPLARDARETAAVLAAARGADRLLAIDLSYRHVAGVPQMREIVQSGEIGKLFAAELVFHNAYGPDKEWFYDPVRAGGGCVIDLGTHLIDLALWVTGSKRAAVADACCYAGGRTARDRDRVEDFARLRLMLDGDVTASISCSWNLHAGRDAEIEAAFYGTSGAVVMRNVNGSFYDFTVERHRGTACDLVAGPPDAWSGRAVSAWARALGRSPTYDPDVESVGRIASIVDRVYSDRKQHPGS